MMNKWLGGHGPKMIRQNPPDTGPDMYVPDKPKHIKPEDTTEEKINKLKYNAEYIQLRPDVDLLRDMVADIVDILSQVIEKNNPQDISATLPPFEIPGDPTQ